MKSNGRGEDAVVVGRANVLRSTEKALLVELEGEEKWIPKSCIHDDSEVYDDGHEGELVLKKWFAEKEGLA